MRILNVLETAMPHIAAPLKKATNITLSSDVLEDAKKFGINISQTCDAYQRDLLKKERERRWLAEHAEYIAAHTKSIEEEGLPLEQYRSF